jgi:hypothetical protein
MYPRVNTKDPIAVQVEAQAAYTALFPRGDRFYLPKIFGWAIDCFTGGHPGYRPIDARYHDFEHTLQVTLCMVRLLHRSQLAEASPRLTRRMFELGVLAILLHDTGYLKRRSDSRGTGAKYTLIHVDRSAKFAAALLSQKGGFSEPEIQAVQDMIHCTGVNTDLNAIPFQSKLVRRVGFTLGTADLLGQMAAADYVEKLPVLYLEFEESARHQGGKPGPAGRFESADDLMRKTPAFWEKYVLPKLNREFEGIYRYLSVPYPDGPNEYVIQIEANIARLRRQLAAVPA